MATELLSVVFYFSDLIDKSVLVTLKHTFGLK